MLSDAVIYDIVCIHMFFGFGKDAIENATIVVFYPTAHLQ